MYTVTDQQVTRAPEVQIPWHRSQTVDLLPRTTMSSQQRQHLKIHGGSLLLLHMQQALQEWPLITVWNTSRFVLLGHFLLNLCQVCLEVLDGLQETTALGMVRQQFLCVELKQGFKALVVLAQLIKLVRAECNTNLCLIPAT